MYYKKKTTAIIDFIWSFNSVAGSVFGLLFLFLIVLDFSKDLLLIFIAIFMLFVGSISIVFVMSKLKKQEGI